MKIEVDGKTHPCSLLGIQRGEVHLSTEHVIDAGREIILTFDRLSVAGKVVYSKPAAAGYRTCIAPRNSQNPGRTEPRFPIDEPAILVALPDGAGGWSSECRLVDFSRSGVGLVTVSEVSPGTMVCVETASFLAAGEVRYSRPAEDGEFRLGIELTDVFSDAGLHGRGSGMIHRIRLRLAEFVLGRPISGPRGSRPML